jgi:hypothetical protein
VLLWPSELNDSIWFYWVRRRAPMSSPAKTQDSTADLRELSGEVHLRNVRELFTIDDFDPFDPGVPMQSGVEQIKAAAQNMKMPEKINVTLYLPPDKLEQETVPSIRAALARYSAYRDREIQAEIAALKREALLELRVGAIVLAIVVGVGLLLALLLAPALAAQNPLASVLSALLGGALVIALWVVVWAPIETFFVEPLPLIWERRFYQRLRDAELDLCPESIAASRS